MKVLVEATKLAPRLALITRWLRKKSWVCLNVGLIILDEYWIPYWRELSILGGTGRRNCFAHNN